ncbi:MAG: hypothetical protein M3352_00130 [Bacteroidota bacterium]|nr:hypothetical protein [Bacteroidota bacterium]
MLSVLTAYFIKNKKLYIPSLGSFKLTELPATLDFADRLIYPPAHQVSFFEKEELDQDQIIFISDCRGVNTNDAAHQLRAFGQQIKHNIQQSAFNWNGVGMLEYLDDKFVFHPHEKKLLLPVTANKVFRENAHHAVLVGEKEMQSNNMHEVRHITSKRTPSVLLIALIILILAVLFIAYHFYNKGLIIEAAGLG